MKNTIGLEITCFLVVIYSAIDQGYMGLSLASCHKDDEIWDLQAEPSPNFGTSLTALKNLYKGDNEIVEIWTFNFLKTIKTNNFTQDFLYTTVVIRKVNVGYR